jgi:monoamine oxidase
VNWRVVEGYGATIAEHGGSVPVALGAPVRRIDHSGKKLKIDTNAGTITAARAIVTLPTNVLSAMDGLLAPALSDKIEAARNLPLGLNDKLFLALDKPEQFEKDSRLFGHKDASKTAAYHIRPFGRAMIECYFGGDNARELEAAGEGAFFDFAVSELTGILGNDFAKRVKPIAVHRWGADPFARGAYSYATPKTRDAQSALLEPEAGIFFSGEALYAGAEMGTVEAALASGSETARVILSRRG